MPPETSELQDLTYMYVHTNRHYRYGRGLALIGLDRSKHYGPAEAKYGVKCCRLDDKYENDGCLFTHVSHFHRIRAEHRLRTPELQDC